MNHTDVAKYRDIKISRKRNCPCFRKIFKPASQGILSISFSVIVRTMRFLTSLAVQALFYFEIIRMKLLFLPTMTIRASIFILAPIFIWCDKSLCVPVLTHIFWIVKNWRFSSVILPIVCINTNVSFMIIFPIRTPYGFKMEKVKVHVGFEFFNEFNW